MKLEITAVKRTRRKEPHLCISHVGGVFTTGKTWRVHIAEVVSNIESGKHKFYIVRNGTPIDVIVAVHEGNKYIKAVGDIGTPEQLLMLPSLQG